MEIKGTKEIEKVDEKYPYLMKWLILKGELGKQERLKEIISIDKLPMIKTIETKIQQNAIGIRRYEKSDKLFRHKKKSI